MKSNFILILSIFFFFFFFGQVQRPYTNIKYVVDNQVSNQVKKFASNDSGVLRNSMFIEVDRNGSPFFNYYKDPLDCYTQTIFSNDTLYITGHLYGEIGYGFLIALFNDSCILTSFAYSDSAIYKFNKSDTSFLAFIPVPSLNQKLVLSETPSYKDGDIISGFIELESKEFYYGIKSSELSFRIKLKAHFRTSPLNKSQ